MKLPVVIRAATEPLRAVWRFGTPERSGGAVAQVRRPRPPDFRCPVCAYELRYVSPPSARYGCPRCFTPLGPRPLD